MGVLNRSLTFEKMVGSGEKKWGASNPCPACSKNVYPNEQVFAADRKPWHKRCLKCAVMGCSNELFERGFHKTPDGKNICDSCNEIMFEPKSYGPAPGMESLEERRLRAAREAEERERKLKEIEMMRNKKDDFGDTPQVYCKNNRNLHHCYREDLLSVKPSSHQSVISQKNRFYGILKIKINDSRLTLST